MQKTSFTYYEKNRRKLIELYAGKYIVITEGRVLGVFSTHDEAYDTAVKTVPVGSFIIKRPLSRSGMTQNS